MLFECYTSVLYLLEGFTFPCPVVRLWFKMTYDRATFTVVAEGDQYALSEFESQLEELGGDHVDVDVVDCDVDVGVDES